MEMSFGYRSKVQSSSDNDSNSESDTECVWKRATNNKSIEDKLTGQMPKTVPKIEESGQNSSVPPRSSESLKRKRNNIWSEVLQDQMMSETLTHCGLKKKPKHYGERGEESYDYTLKYKNSKKLEDSENSMAVDDESSNDNSNNDETLKHKNKKFCKMDSKSDHHTRPVDYKKNLLRTNEFVKLTKDEIHAAQKILKVLNEKKQYIIYRIVKYTGIEKALHLLKMTEQIEEEGGMMIKNNARRRTPGGVYLQLLKGDKDVTKQMLDKIFENEMTGEEFKKFSNECKKRKAELKKLQKKNNSAEKEDKTSEPDSIQMEEVESEVAAEEMKLPTINEESNVVNIEGELTN